MSDYTKTNVGSGYNSTSAVNSELSKIEESIATKMDTSGDTMSGDLDMNSNDILNVSSMDVTNMTLGGTNVTPSSLVLTDLPSQAGNDRKYLTTNGALASWREPETYYASQWGATGSGDDTVAAQAMLDAAEIDYGCYP
jgi:hypothetical protein